jgi:hypothetical protein
MKEILTVGSIEGDSVRWKEEPFMMLCHKAFPDSPDFFNCKVGDKFEVTTDKTNKVIKVVRVN